MRLFGGAFSGYARGRFLTMLCRALLASASAPPPYSRKSRFAAIFRENLVLYLIISRASKTTHSDNKVIAQLCQFCMNARKRSLRKIDCVRCASAPLFGNPLPYGRGEIDAHIIGVPLNSASMRGKPLGFPLQFARFCFISLKQNLRAALSIPDSPPCADTAIRRGCSRCP